MSASKRVMAVLVFLAAMPAWAVDICNFGGGILLPPVYVWLGIAWMIGLDVQEPRSVQMALGGLVIGGLPALGVILFWLSSSFHESKLEHETLFWWSLAALILLLTSHVWAFWRLLKRVPTNKGHSCQPSQP
ncbi:MULTISPECIES: hypothetical protein [unclassified Corallococcus]|uniref:hypothetical protein n=1 Tax=unclassified Corallococcus TaxID=2685029 RepID=UPI001A8E7C89|nr:MULTISPECIES: hypothetical protein [unclassified Corallococcus]MBN9684641.1 hypothetical protein [Corallococcus sp. NCSPR001]WAS83888.1 hypothetical protein O0N60_31870 [Corallococcus sp. NCRR]